MRKCSISKPNKPSTLDNALGRSLEPHPVQLCFKMFSSLVEIRYSLVVLLSLRLNAMGLPPSIHSFFRNRTTIHRHISFHLILMLVLSILAILVSPLLFCFCDSFFGFSEKWWREWFRSSTSRRRLKRTIQRSGVDFLASFGCPWYNWYIEWRLLNESGHCCQNGHFNRLHVSGGGCGSKVLDIIAW